MKPDSESKVVRVYKHREGFHDDTAYLELLENGSVYIRRKDGTGGEVGWYDSKRCEWLVEQGHWVSGVPGSPGFEEMFGEVNEAIMTDDEMRIAIAEECGYEHMPKAAGLVEGRMKVPDYVKGFALIVPMLCLFIFWLQAEIGLRRAQGQAQKSMAGWQETMNAVQVLQSVVSELQTELEDCHRAQARQLGKYEL